MAPTFAISLQDQVEKYGAYVAIAAFFGLAVLTLLYFAQAREVKRLREWAEASAQRAQEFEARALAAARARQPPAAPLAPATAAPAAVPAAAAPAKPRTTVHPAAAAAAIPAPATAAGVATPGQPAAVPVAATAPTAPAVGAGATTPAPPTNGRPPEVPVTGPLPPAPPRPAPAPRRPAPAYGAATAAGRPVDARPRSDGGRSGRGLVLAAGGVVVALAGLVFLGTQLVGGDDAAPRPNAVDAAPRPGAGGAPAGATQSVEQGRRDTTVAVLNGTTTSGLAASIAEKLQEAGYPEGGKVETGPDQTRTSTIVYYAEGERTQARDVAKLLGTADVAPMDPDTQLLAGANARLLVLVGSDQIP